MFGRGFESPDSVSSDGTHVWVADIDSVTASSVTEVDAATGALIKILHGSPYGFVQSSGIDSDGTNVWVTDGLDNTVTGFPAG